MEKVHRVQLSRYRNSLLPGRSGDQILEVVRFSAPIQMGPGSHPESYTMGTGSFPGVKRPRRGIDHPPPSSAEVKERLELYLYSTSGPSWSVIGWNLPLLLPRVTTKPPRFCFSARNRRQTLCDQWHLYTTTNTAGTLVKISQLV